MHIIYSLKIKSIKHDFFLYLHLMICSEKCRAPAWCDRVLWKGDMIKSISYKSYSELKISDHKPVSASFESQVKMHKSMDSFFLYYYTVT